MSENTQLTTREDSALSQVMPEESVSFDNSSTFKHLQRVATMFSKSQLVPDQFRGEANLPNAIIALEMATRLKASPLAVMQNIYIVHGKPSWSSQFIISCINACGRYSPLRFRFEGEGDKRTCTAYASDTTTGKEVEGVGVSIEMAKKEGWFQKTGSKWQSMPELMMRYRAATFFGRLYAPEILMGMKSVEEHNDIEQPKKRTVIVEANVERETLEAKL